MLFVISYDLLLYNVERAMTSTGFSTENLARRTVMAAQGCWQNIGLMLDQRRRKWPIIRTRYS